MRLQSLRKFHSKEFKLNSYVYSGFPKRIGQGFYSFIDY
jgi:hypothetical protein